MPALSCDVATCIHNSERCCCKGAILVEGQNAEKPSSTCCSSFDEKTEDCCKNSYETKNLALAVECEAVNCRFNEAKKCKAKHITISGHHANIADETECSSFEQR